MLDEWINESTYRHIKKKGNCERRIAGFHLYPTAFKKILKAYKFTSNQPITCIGTAWLVGSYQHIWTWGAVFISLAANSDLLFLQPFSMALEWWHYCLEDRWDTGRVWGFQTERLELCMCPSGWLCHHQIWQVHTLLKTLQKLFLELWLVLPDPAPTPLLASSDAILPLTHAAQSHFLFSKGMVAFPPHDPDLCCSFSLSWLLPPKP